MLNSHQRPVDVWWQNCDSTRTKNWNAQSHSWGSPKNHKVLNTCFILNLVAPNLIRHWRIPEELHNICKVLTHTEGNLVISPPLRLLIKIQHGSVWISQQKIRYSGGLPYSMSWDTLSRQLNLQKTSYKTEKHLCSLQHPWCHRCQRRSPNLPAQNSATLPLNSDSSTQGVCPNTHRAIAKQKERYKL